MASDTLTEEVKREVGQHFIPGFVGQEVTPEVVSLIRNYHVGSIIIMKRNVTDIPHLRKLIADLQAVAKDAGHAQPLMIGIDQENGLVSAFSTAAPLGGTQFPGAMAQAATGQPEITELVNTSTGREMQLAGINWAFSPVCDINSDPRNPVIGVRSFGDDPAKVVKFTAAAARGLTYSGIAPSPKHFPGHGDTHVDSHLGLPRILKTKEQLEATELVPFKELVTADVATIMTGHMALPLIVGDDTPCSLSRKITTNLLRDDLAYKGVIVTDCLEMDAVAAEYGVEQGAVMALQAGADVVMICHRIDRQRGAIEATYKAIQSGELSLGELKASGGRVRALKERFSGSWENVLKTEVDTDLLQEFKRVNALVSGEAYSKSTAVLRDKKHVIPLKLSEGSLVVFTPEMETLNRAVDDAENVIRTADGKLRNTAGPSYTVFAASIAERVPHRSTHVVYGAGNLPPDDIKDAAAIIFTTRNADRSTWQIAYLKSLLTKVAPSARIIVLATLTPYEVLEPVAGPDAAYMCSFEFTPQALHAAAAVIFGGSKAQGVSPVQGGD
ncbi:glycoside hydrolase family 3 protein [Ramaria rubella]|nr:glycoside hydrolase family 3 protein [Ramaria rubella]